MSAPMQGGSTSLVSEIVNRIMLRDPYLNPTVVGQEAEVAVSEYFSADPYSIDPDTISLKILSGLTYYTMARCYVIQATYAVTSTAGHGSKWVAGIVQLDQSQASSVKNTAGIWDAIDRLLKLANVELQWNVDVVLLMQENPPGSGLTLTNVLKGVDLSRATIEIYAVP
jgi:hypothetical protein